MRQEHPQTSRTSGASRAAAGRLTLLAAWGVLFFGWASASAHAQFVNGSFKINIGESARVLDAMLRAERGEITQSQYLAIKTEELWKAPGTRLLDRNRPAILLQNISDLSTNNEISQFTIDIRELGYEFGTGDFNPDQFSGLTALSKHSQPGVTVAANYGTVSPSDSTIDPTKLVLNFGGLTPGKSVLFRVDLDPVPMNNLAYPDYQIVLVGGSGSDPNDTTTPASITALFASGIAPNRITTATTPADFAVGEGQTFPQAGLFEAYHNQSASNLYSQIGSTGGEVPEPSTVLLLLAGMAGLASRRRRENPAVL